MRHAVTLAGATVREAASARASAPARPEPNVAGEQFKRKRRATLLRAPGLRGASLLVSALIGLPMGAVLWSLTQPSGDTWVHIRDTLLTEYLQNTLWLMLQVSAYALGVGVTTAWLTTATEFPGRRSLAWALMLPLAAPAYIVAYVYTELLDYSGPVQTVWRDIFPASTSFPEIRSIGGAGLVLGMVLYPYVYLLARTAFAQRSMQLFDAARTLGASPTRSFFRIALPPARPAIAGGLALVLMETLADFGVVEYFGVPTFSTGIFRAWFASGDKRAATKLAAVMFVFVLLLVLGERTSRGRAGAPAEGLEEGTKRLPLGRGATVAAWLMCLLPISLGCLIPLGSLLDHAWTVGDPLWGDAFIGFTLNSLMVAGAAAVVAVALAVFLATTERLSPDRVTRATVTLATRGYAIPGTMLAVGLLAPLTAADKWLVGWLTTHFGWRSGLLLTGTVIALVYAYVTRFLTVAYNATSSGLERIPPPLYDAALTLGATPGTVVRRVQFPLMRGSIVTAALVVFVDAMRELPATLLLRPFNFETLATRVYRLAGDERLAEASSAALTIVVFGTLPVLLLARRVDATT
ncbi:MAG: iron ABC transporter permease [Myxococcota bacterium]